MKATVAVAAAMYLLLAATVEGQVTRRPSTVWHPDSLRPDSLAGCFAFENDAVDKLFGAPFASDTVRLESARDTLLTSGGRTEGSGRIYPTRRAVPFDTSTFRRFGPEWYVYVDTLRIREGALGGATTWLVGTADELRGRRELYGDLPMPRTAADTGIAVWAARVPCPPFSPRAP